MLGEVPSPLEGGSADGFDLEHVRADPTRGNAVVGAGPVEEEGAGSRTGRNLCMSASDTGHTSIPWQSDPVPFAMALALASRKPRQCPVTRMQRDARATTGTR